MALINLRNALMAGKRLDVTDYSRWGESSLLSMFDGIRNVGATTPHDGSITTGWTDIVRNVDATGSVDEMTDIGPKVTSGMKHLAFTIPITTSNTAWTMEICFETIAHSGYWVVFSSQAVGISRFQFNVEDNLRFHAIASSVRTLNSGITNDADKNGTIAVAWNGSLAKLYWNGVYKAQLSLSTSYWQSVLKSRNVSFFSRPETSTTYVEPFWGTIHGCRIYDDALTASEIAANYAIDKARFNLP